MGTSLRWISGLFSATALLKPCFRANGFVVRRMISVTESISSGRRVMLLWYELIRGTSSGSIMPLGHLRSMVRPSPMTRSWVVVKTTSVLCGLT